MSKKFFRFNLIGFIVAILLITAWYYFMAYPSKEFIPLRLKEDGASMKLISAPELLTPDFLDNLVIVLDFHGEKYCKIDDLTLLIPIKLYLNKEMIWNYTTKAGDKQFVAEILAMKKTGSSEIPTAK